MGTRADFYVGRGENAEWIGSITWDGYPTGIAEAVLEATTEDDFRREVSDFFARRNDVTLSSEPWPWPWENSQTTDYAYAFDGERVYASCFGHTWFEVDPSAEDYGDPDYEEGMKVPFPDMSARKGGHDFIMSRSGLISVRFPGGAA